MRLINTKAHGIYDYSLALVLLNGPMLFGYSKGSAADLANLIVSIYLLTVPLCTNFELGLLKKIPLKFHLWADLAAGAFLATSPWLMHYAEETYKSQLVFGLSLLMVSVLTDRLPAHEALRLMGKGRTRRKENEETKQKEEFPGFKFMRQTEEDGLLRAVKKKLGSALR